MVRGFILALIMATVAVTAGAAEIVVEVKRGATKTIEVPANYPHNKLTVYFRSVGNISLFADLSVSGPNGLSATASYRQLYKNIKATLAAKKNWNALPFIVSGKSQKSWQIGNSALRSSRVAMATTSCGGLSEEEIQNLIQIYKLYFGLTYSRSDICGQVGSIDIKPGTGGGGIGANTGTRLAIQKDTCSGNKKTVYVVKLNLSLAKVSAETKAQGYSINVSVVEDEYRGSRAATIKPTSEGKFAPRPLVLMSSIGYGTGGEKVNVVKWASGKIRSQTSLKVEDYVFYRQWMLTRSVADRILRGGRATFELTNGLQMYSVCFNLSRTRQRVNGYTN